MDEDIIYQDPEITLKEAGDVDFLGLTDALVDGKDHNITYCETTSDGSSMLVYGYDEKEDRLEVTGYDRDYNEETLYVKEHGEVTEGSLEKISAFTDQRFRGEFQQIERDETIPVISEELPEIEEPPMDYQELLDYEHGIASDTDHGVDYDRAYEEMNRFETSDEEDMEPEIDFGETYDDLPDERFEGMEKFEDDDLSFLPSAEENMMADIISVKGERPEYIVENPDIHADYGMQELSPRGQEIIAEAMDKSIITPLGSGFIDFELREGFRGNVQGLTADDISKIRQHDPGFGKIIGIDTTQFHTSGPEKNVTIIKLDYEDIQSSFQLNHKGFEKENVVPGSIRAYKEFGKSMKVDGMRFGVTNIVTFEAKLKGEDMPYRTTCVMDDSGRVRGFLEVQESDHRIPLDLRAKLGAAPGTETHIERLDRTDPDNPACIPSLRNADPETRQMFMEKVEAQMPAFMENFCEGMKENFLERKDALVAKLDEARQEKEAVHIEFNKVELVRENALSELAEARTAMQDICEDMNDIMLGYYPINNKINDVDVKLNKEDITKEEKESLEKERSELVKEREAIDQKLDDMKPGLVEKYNEYLKISEHSDLSVLDQISSSLDTAYLHASGRVEGLSIYLDRVYGADTDDGYGNLLETKIIDGIEYAQDYHGEERFQMVCAWEGLKETLPYQAAFKDYLMENPDHFTEIDERLEKIVDAYNETVPDTDKISIGEDGQPYTKDGILVEAVTTGQHGDFPENPIEKLYNRDMDTSHSIPPTFDEKGKEHIDTQKIKDHMGSPVESGTRTKADVAGDFIKNGITRGLGKDELRITDQAVTGPVQSQIGVAMEVPSNRMNFDKELYSLCKVIENHGSYDKVPDIKELSAEADEIYKKMIVREEGPFPDLDRGVEAEKNDTDTHTDTVKNDISNDKIENIFRSKIAGGFGKIDVSKDVELSDNKKQEIRIEAEKEAKHSDEPLDKIIERKENAAKEEIRAVAKDIIHYKNVMEKISNMGIPDRYLSRYTPLMRMKLEYDTAIRKAEGLGCKIGEGCFITKSVSILEMRLEQLEYYRSDMPTSRVMEAILGQKVTRDDLYKETVERDGKEETIEHASYSKFVTALEPFYAVGGAIGSLFGILPIYPHEKQDVEKQTAPKGDIEKENPDEKDEPDNLEKEPRSGDSIPENDPPVEENDRVEQPSEDPEAGLFEKDGLVSDKDNISNMDLDKPETETDGFISKNSDIEKTKQPDIEPDDRVETDTDQPDEVEKEKEPEDQIGREGNQTDKEEIEPEIDKEEVSEDKVNVEEQHEDQTDQDQPEDTEKPDEDPMQQIDQEEDRESVSEKDDTEQLEKDEEASGAFSDVDDKSDQTDFESNSDESTVDHPEKPENAESEVEEPVNEESQDEPDRHIRPDVESDEDRTKVDAIASEESYKDPVRKAEQVEKSEKEEPRANLPDVPDNVTAEIDQEEFPDTDHSNAEDLPDISDALKDDIENEIASIFDGKESIDHLLQETIGDEIADANISQGDILDAIADGIMAQLDISEPDSVSTAADLIFETMHAVDSGDGSSVPGDTFDEIMNRLEDKGMEVSDLEKISDCVNQTADEFGRFDTESYGEADGMTLTDDGFTDDISMDDQTDSICDMMIDAMDNLFNDPVTSDMDLVDAGTFQDEYPDVDYGVDVSDETFGEQLFDKLEAAGFAPDDSDLPTVDASQDQLPWDSEQDFEYPSFVEDYQDDDPFENSYDYSSID